MPQLQEPGERLIVGNLDCEAEWARWDAMRRAGAGGDRVQRDPRYDLPQSVMRLVSPLATLLRVFAQGGDRLWTPLPVDPQRVVPVPALACPRLESGTPGKVGPADTVLAWGETPRVAQLRPGSVGDAGVARSGVSVAQVSARVNHRAFCLQARSELKCPLAGATLVRSLAELEAQLAGGVANVSSTGRWVLKAPYSAAGRMRLFGSGRHLDALASPPIRGGIERLLELQGSLILEPWMERLADFGCCGSAGEDGVDVAGVHEAEVDGAGRFRGVVLEPPGPSTGQRGGVSPREREAVMSLTEEVGQMLRRAGYRGFFCVDGWRYRDARGIVRLQALGEINARMSFGLIARELRERLARAGVLPEDSPLRLTLRERERRGRTATSWQAIPLLLPATAGGDDTSAWAEIPRSGAADNLELFADGCSG